MLEWTSHERQMLLSPESRARFEKARRNPQLFSDNKKLRNALLDFIADFANWDNSTIREYIDTSRTLTLAAHEALGGAPGTRPIIVDPFAGGGSIPLEALRVGADAFASDLNPIPVLLNKIAIEYIPKYGQYLADEVRRWGEWIKCEAEKILAEFYPEDPDGATPIAYLWARTIQCEGPSCGAEVPLIRSLWLAKKVHRSVALQLVPQGKYVDFKIIVKQNNTWVDQANPEIIINNPMFDGTLKRGSATCPCCGYTTPVTRIRQQLSVRSGGTQDARLFCVVTTRKNESRRFYRLPEERDSEFVRKAAKELGRLNSLNKSGRPLVPDEQLPLKGTLGFRIQNYGILKWGDVFNPRQALTLAILSELVTRVGEQASNRQQSEESAVVQALLCISLSRLIGRVNSLCWWRSDAGHETIEMSFSGQTVPMKWDFAEGCPLTGGTAGWNDSYAPPARAVENLASLELHQGTVVQSNATTNPLPDDAANAYITDPPYYDAVPYAALSDFFYVWLKRTIPLKLADLFSESVTPKTGECIVDETSGKDRFYFEQCMGHAMAEGRRVLSPTGVGVLVFAHKSTSGWESQLQAMVDAAWIITGSWPIDTEMGTRLRALNSAALASSVHLVCRPRENPDGSVCMDKVGDWRKVLAELPQRIHEWMPRLAEEGVVGADAIFACLGPALEIFSRYSRVEKTSGEVVTLREYLEQIWAAVSKEALSMIFTGADASGFEEDARLTAMWLWTLKTGDVNGDNGKDEEEDTDEDEASSKKSKLTGFSLEFDAARKIAQGLGAHLESLDHLVTVHGETATLIPVAARTRYLFGKEASEGTRPKPKKKDPQLKLDFDGEIKKIEEESGLWTGEFKARAGSTTLDQLHQCMILFASNRSEALKRLIVEEGFGRNPLFWRLAQALSALYPSSSDEKRWVDGVLARKKGLGF